MLGLLLLIIWLIPLVAFLLRNALCSELVKRIQKGNRLYQICAAICVVGIVAWGGVKPNMSMDCNSTAQNINGTNINTLNSTIGANSSTSFSDVELASRLVFLDGGTNSSFIATAPTNAIVNQKWVMTGAAEDFVIVSPTNWAFPVNDKVYSNLFVSTTGNISFEKPITRTNAFTNQYTVLSPFRSVQSVLPYHLWSEIGNNAQSRFWYATTEYNSLLLTWENFLYLRNANYPISYQAELFKNGEFEFRYNLDSLPSNPTNAFIGYQVDNIANEYTSIATQTKTIKAQRLDSSIENNKDSDGDGISDADEIFIYGTDPTLADSDFDGMSDNQELLTDSNPLNPDEDGDGNRDYLTPELSNPEGIVVSTLREASAVFVFDTILPEGSYATLVINSTIIPLTSQSQIYLYFEGGRLYNYELHVPRNVIPNFSFLDADRLVNSTFSLRGADAEAQEASNEEDKIMSEVQKVIYTIDDEPLKYNGNVGDASIEFVHLPGSTLFPIQSPCIHGNEEISVLLRTVPSEFLAKGEIIDVDNLVHEGNNIYTMAVDGIGYDNRNYGSITYRCPESNEEVTVYVNAHICESNANAYCYGCGVYHKNGTCPIHTGMCQVPYVVSTNCTCELELVEIKLCDVNANGVEDRYDDLASNIKTLKLIDNVEGCCCRDYAISEIRNVSLGNGLNNIETNQTADTINVVGRNHSGQIGYTTIDYDVYRSDGEKVNSITKKVIVLGLDLMFDYNDDGVINSEDKQLQYYHSTSNYYVSASSEILPIRIKAEIPPNLIAGCSSPNLNLFVDADGEISYEQSTTLTNGVYDLYYQSSLTNANASINLGCHNYLEKTQNITFVDTSLTNLTARFGDAIELPYYGSEMINRISIYNKESSDLCEEFYSDGKWIVGIPQGEYRLVVYYDDIYRDGVKGFAEECTLIVIGSNSVAGDYGLKCGTNNFLRIDVLNIDNLPFDITWKISPTRLDGAKLSVSEDVDDAAHQIISNASSIYIYAGTATNNYTISGWMGNTEVVSSANISVHVFPYEIDAPDQIVRSKSIKSAPIKVETLPEYNNHSWKLIKTFNASGSNTELARIGATTNSIDKTGLNSSQVYFKSDKAGEKYNLMATHELYTNVTDTVEFRTCDIFFNPISCKISSSGKIINPRSILHGDDFSTYELTVIPKDFLTSKVEWKTYQNLIVNEDNDKNLVVGIKSLSPYSQAYQANVTINIPDYYEAPPTTEINVYNKLDIINIELVVVKHDDSQYINYNEGNMAPSLYNFSSSNEFYSVFTTNFTEKINYANKIFKQAGIQFKVTTTNEIVNPDVFFFSTASTNTQIQSLLPSFDGIRVFVVDSITNANYYAITRHNDNWSKLYGIVLKKDNPIQTLAHELGHALSLRDIYDHNSTIVLRQIPSKEQLPYDFTGDINYYNLDIYDIVTACLMNGAEGDNPSIRNTILPIGRVFGFKAIDNKGCVDCYNKLESANSKDCTRCLGQIRVGISNIKRNVTTYGENNE